MSFLADKLTKKRIKGSRVKGKLSINNEENETCSRVKVNLSYNRTISGNRKGAHVHLEGWKHGNRDTGLNMACTQ